MWPLSSRGVGVKALVAFCGLHYFLLIFSFIEKSEKRTSKEDISKDLHHKEPIQTTNAVRPSQDQKSIVQYPVSDQPNDADDQPIDLPPDQLNSVVEPIIDQTEDSSMPHNNTKRHLFHIHKSLINHRGKKEIYFVFIQFFSSP